jgi:diamine N-acetyltransferase
MLTLRTLTESDVQQIRKWPPYPGDMEQMDYALREPGWLNDCGAGRHQYAVGDAAGELVGFTILQATAESDAEFRIALRADRTGLGLGEAATLQTLQRGFLELGLCRIHLIVRKNNTRGIRLYQRLGFTPSDECRQEVNGSMVDFWQMEIRRDDFVER